MSKVDLCEVKSDLLNVSQAMSDFTEHQLPLDDNFATKPEQAKSRTPSKKPKTATGKKPLARTQEADDKKNSVQLSQRSISKTYASGGA
jgi:hypothetical protein